MRAPVFVVRFYIVIMICVCVHCGFISRLLVEIFTAIDLHLIRLYLSQLARDELMAGTFVCEAISGALGYDETMFLSLCA